MMQIPHFREVYTKRLQRNSTGIFVITRCELQNEEDHYKVLASGEARVFGEKNYHRSVGKLISYAIAMHYLFLKMRSGRKSVEDHT
jgi:hypothetical protein